MKKLLTTLTILSLLIGCSVDPAPFNKAYDEFKAEYISKRENVRTTVQYDSLKLWAKDATMAIVAQYADAGFSDTTLIKLADLMSYADMNKEAIINFEKGFSQVEALDKTFVNKYIDLLMKEDLSLEENRSKVEKTLDIYSEILGDKVVQKTLYYGYYLSEKNQKDAAMQAFSKVIEANAGASLTGQAVLEVAAITFEDNGVEKALEFLKEKDSAFPDNKMIKEKIIQFSLIGKKAPELTKVVTMGDAKSLRKLKGKVVMVDFWAPWCAPCRKAFPEMKELYSEFKDKGFEIVGATNYYPFYRDEKESIQNISEEEYDKKLEEFKVRHELPWPFMVAKDKVNRNNYGVSFIPTFFLIDRNGVVQYAQVGTKEDPNFLKEKIKALL